MGYFGWRPYVSVAERRRKAAKEMEKLAKKGHPVSPVVLDGRTIARTFWGKAWCDNLERYSDFENRLPSGRPYVRNGSVVDLQIAPGEIQAMVSGSELYRVKVKVAPVSKARWQAICTDCAGAIDSLVELLQGRFSKGVMERVCRERTGLFPAPHEIELSCSCPDWAEMCKHVAAVLYGIGARIDRHPELLFRLHDVDENELIAGAGKALPLARQAPATGRILGGEDVSAIFGLDMAPAADAPAKPAASKPAKAKRVQAAPARKKAAPPAKKGKPKPKSPAAKRAKRPPAARKASGA